MRLTNFSCTCCYYSPLTQFATFLSTSFNHRSPIDFQSYQQPKSNWLQWSRIERHPKAKLHFLNPLWLSHVYAFLVVRCKNSSFFLWKRDKGKREEFNFCRAHHNCRLIFEDWLRMAVMSWVATWALARNKTPDTPTLLIAQIPMPHNLHPTRHKIVQLSRFSPISIVHSQHAVLTSYPKKSHILCKAI